MAKDSQIRNIPLEAMCDLTNFQEVADYDGFRETNSLYLNKRLGSWWKQKTDGGYIAGNLTYQKNGGNFVIKDNGKEVMEISRTRYSVEKCESLPALTSCPNPYPDSDDYAWSEFRDGISLMTSKDFEGSFVFGCTMDGKDAYLITSPNGSSYVSRLFVWNDSWSCFQRIGKWNSASRYVFFCHVWKEVPPLKITPAGGYETKIYTYGTTVEPGYYITEYSRNPGDVSTSDGELCSIAKTYKLKQSVNFLDIFNTYTLDTSKDFASDSEDSVFVIGYKSIGRALRVKENGVRNVCIKHINLAEVYYSNFAGFLSSGPFFYKKNTNVTSTLTSVESENYVRRFSNEDGSVQEIADIMRTNSVQSLHTLHPENYSKKFGEFAINYVKNQEYSIGHDYKKILQLDEEEILGYTEDSIYYEKDGVNYRLFMERCDRPQFTVLDDDCVIFNTTTYDNAYNMTYGTVFCSSDDWNNRAQWKLTGEYSDRWALTNSRLNQNWQTQKKIVSTSTQFSSVTNRLAIRTEEKDGATLTYSDAAHMGVFFVDDSYKMPSDVTYDVFFEDYLGDNVGSLIKQGELKNGEFIVNKDEAYIFAEPASDGNQENVPILDCSFRDFNGVTLIQIGDFTYQAMKQTMLGNAFVPVYIVSESGYSATDYIQFVINGQLYTYYPTTNQIIDPNDQFVCDTSTLVYIGYSPKSAYFWSTMDKCVYTFNGDNTMSRLICAERLDLQLQPFKTSSAVLGDALNIPSLDLLVVNFKNKFAVLYDSQLCLIDADGTIEPGTMSINKNDASIIVNDVSYSLIKRNGYAPVPVEIETKFFGDVSGKMNCINDAVYIDVVSFDKAGSGTVDIQTVALVNGSVKEGKKKTIAVRNADFNAVGVATIRYQSDIQECAGFKLKIKSDFSIASIRIGTDAGAMVQPLIKA
jgi:hypothetical protein